ncbi:MAG: polysaccharide biosynthesis/export family protein, partial [Mangrovimonas sp.]|nr:polysaccharide biosynthesis/export family protein [Mangrovimonas sp.]
MYLQNVGGYETMSDLEDYELRFKEGDILGIYVSTLVPEASIPYNLVAASSQSGSSSAAQGVDYIIDSEGNIDFPVLGTVNVAGLTISEVKNLLKTKLVDGGHLKDPTINVRLKNFRVTVLGEVKNPGTFDVPGDRVSVLEAIGMAGDLSIKGRRDNVMIIR